MRSSIFTLNENEEEVQKINKAFGIDLGTTNSALAERVGEGIAEVIHLDTANGSTMPSCIMWLGGDNWEVGDKAYKLRHQRNVAYSMKRMIGTTETITLEYKGETRELGAVEFSSIVLKGLIEKAGLLYKGIHHVVISVPAHFNDAEIKDTIEAGKLAGLNVMNILREPTAASLVYDTGDADKRVLVYDLGGGTFDVSRVDLLTVDPKVVEKGNEVYGTNLDTNFSKERVFRVVANDGDNRLGGDDVDNIVVNMLIAQLTPLGIDAQELTDEDRESLKLIVEETKKMGNVFSREIKIEVGGEDIVLELTGKHIEDAYHIIYQRTKRIIDSLTKPSELRNLDAIALVGGSTKSDLLKGFLRRDYTGVVINSGLDPDQAVALGAALQAHQQYTGGGKMQIEDVIPLSIGVLTENRIETVVPRNSRIPFKVTKNFVTVVDDQPIVVVDIYQGNSTFKDECLFLGRLDIMIENLEPAGKQIQVHLMSNANGLLICEVTIDGKTESKPLKNLIGGSEDSSEDKVEQKKLTSQEKRIIVWSGIINNLPEEDPNKKTGLELIEKMNQGNDSYRELRKFMRTISAVQI